MPRRNEESYKMPVNNVAAEDMPRKMNEAFKAVEKVMPPHTGILIITFDFGQGGGLGYISNGDRAGCIKMLEEWIAYQRTLS
jgi:hypothetical protein